MDYNNLIAQFNLKEHEVEAKETQLPQSPPALLLKTWWFEEHSCHRHFCWDMGHSHIRNPLSVLVRSRLRWVSSSMCCTACFCLPSYRPLLISELPICTLLYCSDLLEFYTIHLLKYLANQLTYFLLHWK